MRSCPRIRLVANAVVFGLAAGSVAAHPIHAREGSDSHPLATGHTDTISRVLGPAWHIADSERAVRVSHVVVRHNDTDGDLDAAAATPGGQLVVWKNVGGNQLVRRKPGIPRPSGFGILPPVVSQPGVPGISDQDIRPWSQRIDAAQTPHASVNRSPARANRLAGTTIPPLTPRGPPSLRR